MRKVIFLLLFLLFNNIIVSQDFGVSTKYTLHGGNSYNAYGSLSFRGSYFFYNNMFEVGPLIAFVYSEQKENYKDIDFSNEEYYFIDITKAGGMFVGASLYFYPVKLTPALSPFIGIEIGAYTKNRVLNFLFYPGGNHIFEPGLYNFRAYEKYQFSILTGFKLISKKGINVIFELEYQHRELTLKYSEYRYNSDGWLEMIERHSEEQIINAFNFGIGLQFVF